MVFPVVLWCLWLEENSPVHESDFEILPVHGFRAKRSYETHDPLENKSQTYTEK